MFDCIVVGSGPAGVFSSYQLRNRKILILDTGLQADPCNTLPAKNIYEIRKAGDDVFDQVIGPNFEAMHNVFYEYMSPKLKTPLMRYVTRLPDGEAKPQGDSFNACLSYSKGGLAGAWGAGVLRFTDRDLRGFPIQLSALERYYDILTDHIGICGTRDDLATYFGDTKALLDPLPLSPQGHLFLKSYEKHRKHINRNGVKIGRTRAAILSQRHNGRDSYPFFSQDFFQPNISAIYSPAYTLDQMLCQHEIEYIHGRLVLAYKELSDRIQVITRNIKTGTTETFEARFLLLAAGAINTAKIVLHSHSDFDSQLPILDNPVSFSPFIHPGRIGIAPDLYAFPGGELIVMYDGELFKEPVQSSVYGLMGPLRSDLIFQLPLTVTGNLAALKYLIPAITVVQTFYPDDPCPDNFLRLQPDGAVHIQYTPKRLGQLERHLARIFRTMGYFGSHRLAQYPTPGSSIHYAGTLPMGTTATKPYQTDSDCLLYGSKRVFIADAASFPRLPSKNLTFTIMANAMRVAEHVNKELSRS